MKKIELNLEFEDLAELRIFMTSDFPFGRMTESKVSVEQADEIVKKSRKKKDDAVEAPVAPTPTAPAPALVEPVPMASVPAGPITAPVAPPAAPVPTSPAPAAVQTTVQTTLGDAIAQAAPAHAPTPVPAAPAPAAQPTPVPTATATYSMDDLRNAATKLLDEGRHGEIAQALQNHGVTSLKDLPVEQYAAFAADLRAMGASV